MLSLRLPRVLRRHDVNRALSGVAVCIICLVVVGASLAYLPFIGHPTYLKQSIFRAGALAVLMIYCVQLLWLGRPLVGRDRLWRSPESRAAALLVLFLALNLLSLVWSRFGIASILRVAELGFYVFWALLIAVYARRPAATIALAATYVVSALASGFWAVYAQHHPNEFGFIQLYPDRISFPAGNPLFLAGYLLPPLGVALCGLGLGIHSSLMYRRNEREASLAWRLLATCGMALTLIALAWFFYLARSRSGYVGLLALLLVVGSLFLRGLVGSRVLARLAFLLAVAVSGALAAWAVFRGAGPAAPLLGMPVGYLIVACLVVLLALGAGTARFRQPAVIVGSIVLAASLAYLSAWAGARFPSWYQKKVDEGYERQKKGEAETLAVRLVLYRGAVPLVLSRPILGYGAGTFVAVYPGFARPEQYLVNRPRVMALNAHCEPLQVAAEVGIVGLGLFLGGLGCAFQAAVHRAEGVRGPAVRACIWGMAAGAVGIFAQDLGSVGLRFWDLAPLFWTSVGVLIGGAAGASGSNEVRALAHAPSGPHPSRAGRTALRAALTALIVAVLAIVGWRVAWLDLMSQKYFKDANDARDRLQLVYSAGAFYERLAGGLAQGGLQGLSRAAGLMGAGFYASAAQARNEMAMIYEKASRLSIYYENRLKSMFNEAQAYSHGGHHERAAELLEQLQRLAPGLDDTRLVLATYYERAGQLPRALGAAIRYLQQNPSSAAAQGIVERASGRMPQSDLREAVSEVSRAIADSRRPTSSAFLLRGLLQYDLQEWAAAAQDLREAHRSGARGPQVSLNLARALEASGQPEAAMGWYRRAVEDLEKLAGTGAPPSVFAELAAAYAKLGDKQRQRQWAERGLAQYPDDPTLLALWEAAVPPQGGSITSGN